METLQSLAGHAVESLSRVSALGKFLQKYAHLPHTWDCRVKFGQMKFAFDSMIFGACMKNHAVEHSSAALLCIPIKYMEFCTFNRIAANEHEGMPGWNAMINQFHASH